MTGELIVKNTARWKQTVLAVALTVVITFAAIVALGVFMHLGTMNFAIIGAVIAYMLFRVVYPKLVERLNRGGKTRCIPWTLTADTLTLGEETVERSNIKTVHCWPNRDALGHQMLGWIVNIETKKGRNHVLYSLDEGKVEQSVESLHALVNALGCADSWEEI